MEAFLREAVPRFIPATDSFEIYPYRGKTDLLGRLEERLRGYAAWLPDDWRIIILLDKDDDDCHALKASLLETIQASGLRTKRTSEENWQAIDCIAIEELEAWFFGEWQAVRSIYPKVSPYIPSKAPYRQCDEIAGGTWEAFERELNRAGYFSGGLRKIEAARSIGEVFSAESCSSPSFQRLRSIFSELAPQV